MKITYGNLSVSTRNFYIIAIFLLFLTDNLFYYLLVGDQGPEAGPPAIDPEKYLAIIALIVPILRFNTYSPFMRAWLAVIYLYFLALVIESYLNFGSFLIYPHVFAKIMTLCLIFMFFSFFTEPEDKQAKNIMYLIVAAFFLHILLFKRDAISFAAFVSTERAISAEATYLVSLPCLFFFIRYLTKEHLLDLAFFFVLFGFILFLQHRTVWVTTTITLVLSFIFLKLKSKARPSVTSISLLVLVPVVIGIAASTFIFVEKPEILDQFAKRFSDIENVEAEGSTSSWRLLQFESYLPYIKDNIVFGMRLQGFELPIQFFNPEAGTAYFEAGTGHHFHSFYVDRLFYFGVCGLIIAVVPAIYVIALFLKKPYLSTPEIALLVFMISGFVFGLSYNWPFYYYGLIGLAMGFAERAPEEEFEEFEVTEETDASDETTPQVFSQVPW
ncbi:O-antigen ligase family protein [Pontibacter silvestris]|uniref:O-antigen ligase family protein n=1 Tax=Pontibacter silvestris TaxID=2305183 RepID=A0ABW4X2P2_9BACT|nr:O-antigen ligase family protein [Pontibacter silvestris]MCC9135065.1 O-antigen ligase family protein [Pontibacter silvestris]